MVDIQSATTEIKRGKKVRKKKERKKKERKKPQGKNVMACSIPLGGHKITSFQGISHHRQHHHHENL